MILCEQTDETGAMHLGERIREELAKAVFQTPNGPLQVTCSVGAAVFPPRAPSGTNSSRARTRPSIRAKMAAKPGDPWSPASAARMKAG